MPLSIVIQADPLSHGNCFHTLYNPKILTLYLWQGGGSSATSWLTGAENGAEWPLAADWG